MSIDLLGVRRDQTSLFLFFSCLKMFFFFKIKHFIFFQMCFSTQISPYFVLFSLHIALSHPSASSVGGHPNGSHLCFQNIVSLLSLATHYLSLEHSKSTTFIVPFIESLKLEYQYIFNHAKYRMRHFEG